MRAAVVALVVFGGSGCATLYDWGSYEDSVARVVEGTDLDPSREIAVLSEEIATTEADNRRVPPGKHAHLGYLYTLVGDRNQAVRHFEAEKAAFPESAAFVDRLLEKM